MAKRRFIKEPEQGVRKLELSSGFTIYVKPLPPYYMDLVYDTLPLPEYPARKIILAAGDSFDWEYKPPDVPPTEEDPDYHLYVKWKAVDAEREKVEQKRNRARQDFLLANCVKVVSGPAELYEQEWAHNVEAAFPGYTVPTHPGRRLLIFLKTQVILTPYEMELILELSTATEANMQGILAALQGFRDRMAKGDTAGGNQEVAEGGGEAQHEVVGS